MTKAADRLTKRKNLLDSGYRQIKGYPDYLISKLGHVISLKQMKRVQYDAGYGYLSVNLRNKSSRNRMVSISILVLETFVGPRPKGHQAAHLNGIKYDNRLENLQWCTPKENNSHKILHGTNGYGDANSNAKLKINQVREILKYKTEATRKFAKKYKISESTVRSIWDGKRWQNVNLV